MSVDVQYVFFLRTMLGFHTQKRTQYTHTHSGEVKPKVNHGLSQLERRQIYHPGSVQEDKKQQFLLQRKDIRYTHTHTHTHTHTQTLTHTQTQVQNRTTSFNLRWFSSPCPHVRTRTLSISHPHTHTHTHTHTKMRKSNYQLAFLSQGNLMHWVRASHLCLVITLSLLYTPFNKL